jgi:hypothetical protein
MNIYIYKNENMLESCFKWKFSEGDEGKSLLRKLVLVEGLKVLAKKQISNGENISRTEGRGEHVCCQQVFKHANGGS